MNYEEQGTPARRGRASDEEGKPVVLRDEDTHRHTGLAHSIVTAAAIEPDVSQTHKLLHGDEKHLHGDAGYQGRAQARGIEGVCSRVHHCAQALDVQELDEADLVCMLIEKAERAKASIRAKVEHVFHVVKNLFRHRKSRYRGLAKNTAQLQVLLRWPI